MLEIGFDNHNCLGAGTDLATTCAANHKHENQQRRRLCPSQIHRRVLQIPKTPPSWTNPWVSVAVVTASVHRCCHSAAISALSASSSFDRWTSCHVQTRSDAASAVEADAENSRRSLKMVWGWAQEKNKTKTRERLTQVRSVHTILRTLPTARTSDIIRKLINPLAFTPCPLKQSAVYWCVRVRVFLFFLGG